MNGVINLFKGKSSSLTDNESQFRVIWALRFYVRNIGQEPRVFYTVKSIHCCTLKGMLSVLAKQRLSPAVANTQSRVNGPYSLYVLCAAVLGLGL